MSKAAAGVSAHASRDERCHRGRDSDVRDRRDDDAVDVASDRGPTFAIASSPASTARSTAPISLLARRAGGRCRCAGGSTRRRNRSGRRGRRSAHRGCRGQRPYARACACARGLWVVQSWHDDDPFDQAASVRSWTLPSRSAGDFMATVGTPLRPRFAMPVSAPAGVSSMIPVMPALCERLHAEVPAHRVRRSARRASRGKRSRR